jgi:hypothetical protein
MYTPYAASHARKKKKEMCMWCVLWHACVTYLTYTDGSMSHVSYIWHTWVMSFTYDTNESCLLHMTYMSHVPYIWHTWVMSLTYDIHESCLLQMVPWVMSLTYDIHECDVYSDTHVWHILQHIHIYYIWVMSPLYESCLLYMSHVSSIWVMSRVTYLTTHSYLTNKHKRKHSGSSLDDLRLVTQQVRMRVCVGGSVLACEKSEKRNSLWNLWNLWNLLYDLTTALTWKIFFSF